ncbi:MAG: hypothetical protein ABIU05_03560 [Nitrospirales bacterium]
MIVVAAIFLILPMLIGLHLYTSGGFTNRRAFRCVFFTLLVLFALTLVLVIHQSNDLSTTPPMSLTDVSPTYSN